MQFTFGSGSMWMIPLTNVAGTAVSNPTPAKLGILQDVSVEFSTAVKELHGTFQFPVAVGRGKGSIPIKAKHAQLNANVWAQSFFGQAGQPTTGGNQMAENEIGTIPGTPFQVTVVNSATFLRDAGVRFLLSGLYLTRVASAPATGQYSVAAGVYTFAAADTTKQVYIDYEFTPVTGFNMTIANQLMGNLPTFRCILRGIYSGNQITFDLNLCTSEKISFATKLDDFAIPELDIRAFADSGNNIGQISMVEA